MAVVAGVAAILAMAVAARSGDTGDGRSDQSSSVTGGDGSSWRQQMAATRGSDGRRPWRHTGMTAAKNTGGTGYRYSA